MRGRIARLLRSRSGTRAVWLGDAAVVVWSVAGTLLLAAVVAAEAGEAAWQAAGLTDPRLLAAVVLCHVPLVWRRQFPVPVFLATLAAAPLAGLATGVPVGTTAPFVAAYAAGAWAPPALAGGVVGAYLALGHVLPAALGGQGEVSRRVAVAVTPVLLHAVPLTLGAAVRWWRLRRERRQDDRERARQVAGDRVAAAERERMARELHDVLAHSISVMVVQAGGAREVLPRDPRRAAEALGHIETTGRQGLVEVSRLVGLLPAGDGAADVEPGLHRVAALVARVREAGVDLRHTVDGVPIDLAPSSDLAAFRVVQEALTNVVRHAPGARASLRLAWSPSRLRIEVRDGGGDGPPAPARPGSGRGLAGMAERVASVGGRLDTGPAPGGGFAVTAELPLETAPGGLVRTDADGARAGPAARPRAAGLLPETALVLAAVGLEVLNLLPGTQRDLGWLYDVARMTPLGPVPVAALVAVALPVPWRRRAPLAVLALVTATSFAANGFLGLPMSWWASLPALSEVAARHPRRVSLPALAGVVVAAVAALAVAGYATGWTLVGTAATYPFWFAIPWALGRSRRERRLLEERRDATARARELRLLADERSRVARELHAVLARSLRVMLGRAAEARALLGPDPGGAARALVALEGGGRAGMAEVRRLLALLRDAEAERSPQPGLGRLDELVERARRAGTPVTVRTVAFRPPGDPSVDVFAYRIVEEALANAGRHAPGAPVTVVLGGSEGRLTVEVVDRGRRRDGPAPAGTGRGLTAMRERAELVGGTLHAGPTRRGFAVRAELPLSDGQNAGRGWNTVSD